VKEYDIFIPLYYNDGRPIEVAKLQYLQQQLLEHFEGLTYFPQPNQGFWKFAGMHYHDQVVIYRVISEHSTRSRKFLSSLKERLKKELNQEEILIVERQISVL